jgi:hypothetical protein
MDRADRCRPSAGDQRGARPETWFSWDIYIDAQRQVGPSRKEMGYVLHQRQGVAAVAPKIRGPINPVTFDSSDDESQAIYCPASLVRTQGENA